MSSTWKRISGRVPHINNRSTGKCSSSWPRIHAQMNLWVQSMEVVFSEMCLCTYLYAGSEWDAFYLPKSSSWWCRVHIKLNNTGSTLHLLYTYTAWVHKNNWPGFLVWKSVLRCRVDGRSFKRRESCRLKGEFFWLSWGKPRKEPCRTSCSIGACRRGMAWGPPGSALSPGEAAPSGGEAFPGGIAEMPHDSAERQIH